MHVVEYEADLGWGETSERVGDAPDIDRCMVADRRTGGTQQGPAEGLGVIEERMALEPQIHPGGVFRSAGQ